MGSVVSLLLLGYFGKLWLVDGDGFFPSILMVVLSLLSLIFTAIVLVQPAERKRDF